MKGLVAATNDYVRELWRAWDAFWFTPADPSALCLIRVLVGAMLLYTHLIWSIDLAAFFGPDGFLPQAVVDASREMRFVTPENPRWSFSYFNYLSDGWALWLVHGVNLLVFFCLTIGLFSRTMAVLACFSAISYATHVTPGAFFGLDKINCMLILYVMLGPCGARYSLDRLFALRRGAAPHTPPSVSANTALRLIQSHMCVIYLFAGLGKLQGELWWNGSATWFAIASTEYRSIDMTWLAWRLPLVDFLTHTTVFLELFFCCLVWNRWARPWVLLGAAGMHLFIGAAMGMIEFQLAMVFGLLAFLAPGSVQRVCDPIARRITLALVGDGSQTPAV
ncbi:MAG: HTTM domain-containing protein [Planctomycetota bacterium]